MTNLTLRTLLLVSAIGLSGCANMADRLANAGKEPKLTQIENPTFKKDYQPVSLPMPDPQPAQREANSLWRSGARAFFKDQRASKVGDIMTVLISIDDQAQLSNSSTRSRTDTDKMGATNLFGLETEVEKILPTGTLPSSLISTNGSSSDNGKGAIARTEKINLQVAAVISQILPNGNLVMNGSQEVRVNNEVRVLSISGVVRPEDITSANTIAYQKVAEARVSYGGRGQMTDVQQPPYGHQIMDIISPF